MFSGPNQQLVLLTLSTLSTLLIFYLFCVFKILKYHSRINTFLIAI